MFILGFIVTMSSTIEIAYKLLYRSQNPLKYVLTYKTSQDHIEIFLGVFELGVGTIITQIVFNLKKP